MTDLSDGLPDGFTLNSGPTVARGMPLQVVDAPKPAGQPVAHSAEPGLPAGFELNGPSGQRAPDATPKSPGGLARGLQAANTLRNVVGDASKELGAGAVQGLGGIVGGIGDLGRLAGQQVVRGVNALAGPGTLSDAVNPLAGAQDALDSAANWVRGTETTQGQAAGSKAIVQGSLLHPSTLQLGEGASDPRAWLQSAANMAGQAVPMIAGGIESGAARLPGAITSKLAAGEALTAAEQATAQAAMKAAGRRTLATGAALGGAQGAEGSAEAERQRIEQMPEADLAKVPGYQQLLASGLSADDARAKLADQAGSGAFAAALPVALAGGVVGAAPFLRGAQEALAARAGDSLARRAAAGAAIEAPVQGVVGAGQQMAQTAGANAATGEDRSLSDGTAAAFGGGALAGALFGGAGAAAHAPGAAPEPPRATLALPPPTAEATPSGRILTTGDQNSQIQLARARADYGVTPDIERTQRARWDDTLAQNGGAASLRYPGAAPGSLSDAANAMPGDAAGAAAAAPDARPARAEPVDAPWINTDTGEARAPATAEVVNTLAKQMLAQHAIDGSLRINSQELSNAWGIPVADVKTARAAASRLASDRLKAAPADAAASDGSAEPVAAGGEAPRSFDEIGRDIDQTYGDASDRLQAAVDRVSTRGEAPGDGGQEDSGGGSETGRPSNAVEEEPSGGVQQLEAHDPSLPVAERQGLSPVRGEGDNRVPPVEEQLSAVPEGHGDTPDADTQPGQDSGQRELRADQLSLGNTDPTGGESSVLPPDQGRRRDADGERAGQEDGAAGSNSEAADQAGVAAGDGSAGGAAANAKGLEVPDVPGRDAERAPVGGEDRDNVQSASGEVAQGNSDSDGSTTPSRPSEAGSPLSKSVDDAAATAATSPENDLPEPTEAQQRAGNYKLGHTTLHGLNISIENPRGSVRSGTDADGKAWSHTMSDHYGYVRGTEGADGDHVDVYIGPKPESKQVWVVDQVHQGTGQFDEHKAMLGFTSKRDAIQAYKANFDKGWKVGPVKAMTVDGFKQWLKQGDTSKPAGSHEAGPTEKAAAAADGSAAKARPKRGGIATNGARTKVVAGKLSYVPGALETLEAYFKPGELVKSYGGGMDRVRSFEWNGGDWKVHVEGVNKDGSPLPAGSPDAGVRTHGTQPTERELLQKLGRPELPQKVSTKRAGRVEKARSVGDVRHAAGAPIDAAPTAGRDLGELRDPARSFGKVVDSEGNPLTVYHGTNQPFEGAFDQSRSRDAGVWFSPIKGAAEAYGKHIIPAHVQLDNPYEAKVGDTISKAIFKAMDRGHDGIIVRDDDGHISTLSAFNSDAIRRLDEESGARAILVGQRPIDGRDGEAAAAYDRVQLFDRAPDESGKAAPARQLDHSVAVLREVRAAVGAWKGGDLPGVRVVPTPEELPVSAKSTPVYKRSRGMYDGQNIYVVASKFDPSTEAGRAAIRATVAHEAVGHFGIYRIIHRELGADAWAKLEGSIERLRDQQLGGAEMQSILASVDRRYPGASRRVYAEEALAVMAERGVRNSLLDRAIAAVRSFLRKVMPDLKLAPAELRQLLVRSDEYLRVGETYADRVQAAQRMAFSASPMKSVDANIARGRSAMDRVLLDKSDVKRAMFRQGLGWVDFVWGSAGGERNSRGRPLNGKGIAHLLDRRMSSDGLSEGQAQQLAHRMVDVIARGTEVARTEIGGATNVRISDDGATAVLLRQKGANAWMLTGFADRKTPGEVSAGRDAADPTRAGSTLTRSSMGAGIRRADDAAAPRGGKPHGEASADQGPGKVLDDHGVVSTPSPSEGSNSPARFSLDDSGQPEEPGRPRRPFSRSAASIDTMQKELPELGEPVLAQAKEWLAGKVQDFKPKLLKALQLRHVLELAGEQKVLAKPAGEYGRLFQQMDADRNERINTGAAEADRVQKWAFERGPAGWAGKLKPEAKQLFQFMHEVTQIAVDPTSPYERLTMRDSRGEQMPWTRDLVKDRIKALRAQQRSRPGDDKTAMTEEIKSLKALPAREAARQLKYPELVAKWNSLSPEAKDLFGVMRDRYREISESLHEATLDRIDSLDIPRQNKLALRQQLQQRFDESKVGGVYFPLSRFGDYWLSGYDKNDEYFFAKYESAAAAAKAEKQFTASGARIEASGRQLADYKASQAPKGTFVADIMDTLRANHAPEKVQDEIYQMYLKTLPELSLRKAGIHRKNIAGYSDNVPRAFASAVFHGAHQVARARYGWRLGDTMESMKGAVEAARSGGIKDTAHADALLGELQKRHEWIMNPTDSQLANKLTSIGFAYYLSASPASALVNLIQNPHITLPVLGAHHGWAPAARELGRSTLAALRTVGNIRKTLDGEERMAYDALQRQGTFQRTGTHSLAGLAEGDALRSSPAYTRVMNAMAWMFHTSEVVNREAAGMAAYRLARGKGQDFNAAIRYADEIVNGTHGDYSNANRARIMQGNVPKVLLQFKGYSLAMTWLWYRNFYKAFKGETPEVRSVARKTVTGMLAMTGLFAGALGMPIANLIRYGANAVHAVTGDDDEPWDFDTEARAWLAEHFGQAAGDIIADGVADRLGAKISSRVGMSDLWFRDADRQLEGRDAYYNMLDSIAGPMGGLLKNMYVGAQQFNEGHTWRGVETMLPSFAKNAVKSIRYANEGANTLRGDPIVPDVSAADEVIQALGFQPTKIADQQRINSALMNYQKFVQDRRQSLVNAFAMAQQAGDAEDRADALASIRAFNQKYPEIAIRMSNLQSSLRTRAERSAQAENGIMLNRKLSARIREDVGAQVDG